MPTGAGSASPQSLKHLAEAPGSTSVSFKMMRGRSPFSTTKYVPLPPLHLSHQSEPLLPSLGGTVSHHWHQLVQEDPFSEGALQDLTCRSTPGCQESPSGRLLGLLTAGSEEEDRGGVVSWCEGSRVKDLGLLAGDLALLPWASGWTWVPPPALQITGERKDSLTPGLGRLPVFLRSK